MTRLRPSTKPASASPLRNPLTMNPEPAAVASRRNPTTGIAGCCARAASGHAAAEPPSSVMNLRRCNRSDGIVLTVSPGPIAGYRFRRGQSAGSSAVVQPKAGAHRTPEIRSKGEQGFLAGMIWYASVIDRKLALADEIAPLLGLLVDIRGECLRRACHRLE